MGRGNRTSWFKGGLGLSWKQCWKGCTIFKSTNLRAEGGFFCGCFPFSEGSDILWNWLPPGWLLHLLFAWCGFMLTYSTHCFLFWFAMLYFVIYFYFFFFFYFLYVRHKDSLVICLKSQFVVSGSCYRLPMVFHNSLGRHLLCNAYCIF